MTAPHPAPAPPLAPPALLPAPPAGRAWAWTGLAGAVVGLAGLMVTGNTYDASTGVVSDNDALLAAVTDSAGLVWAQQVVCAVVAACFLVFAAGLRRALARQEPAGSLVPGLAAAGVVVTAAAVLVGGGISTELYWALAGDQPFDPDTVGAHLALYNTLPWLWAALGVSAAAVAVGGLRHGSVGRPTAVFSLVMALLLAATQAFPVQYVAVVPGGLWVAGTALSAALGRRRA
ncbi:hypothetical protein [Trujillonella endophytica]|uniref:DUF4386 family protein n=1 Tax=Trujillonella endophytica TaxID=673521 RepID=A0A1H8TMD1_9ACTN|nr:hypothetical protein [Trujillella endophytica]SEO91976.1 hypothetical protein SAMN05660991_02390 [Trujillella endophytica]